jgi:hypothetical protein
VVTRALHVIFTAVILLITIPVSQLRAVSVRVECCCPDPDNCHCPDDGEPVPGQSTMKACHRSAEVLAGAPLTAFQAPVAITAHEPSRGFAFAQFSLSSPHAPPSPERPPAPS